MAKLTDAERIAELEQEVKNLTRLVKEMAAREKLNTSRLRAVSQDQVVTAKRVADLDLIARKTDAKIASVHSQIQRRN